MGSSDGEWYPFAVRSDDDGEDHNGGHLLGFIGRTKHSGLIVTKRTCRVRRNQAIAVSAI